MNINGEKRPRSMPEIIRQELEKLLRLADSLRDSTKALREELTRQGGSQ